jgi:hypothetical protein
MKEKKNIFGTGSYLNPLTFCNLTEHVGEIIPNISRPSSKISFYCPYKEDAFGERLRKFDTFNSGLLIDWPQH